MKALAHDRRRNGDPILSLTQLHVLLAGDLAIDRHLQVRRADFCRVDENSAIERFTRPNVLGALDGFDLDLRRIRRPSDGHHVDWHVTSLAQGKF